MNEHGCMVQVRTVKLLVLGSDVYGEVCLSGYGVSSRAVYDQTWWGRRDSNPHGLSHMLLRQARLPFRHSPTISMVLSDAYS